MNNKGQSLILFILLIPIIMILAILMIDSGIVINENIKLKTTAEMAVKDMGKYSCDQIKDNIKANDNKIMISSISCQNKEIHLFKYIEPIFGKIVGYKTYELEAFEKDKKNGE